MRASSYVGVRSLVLIATIGLGQASLSANDDGPVTGQTPKVRTATIVQDVTLADKDVLRGTLVDAGGKGIGEQTVVARQGSRVIATTVTDSQGHFRFTGVRPGLYEIASARRGNLYRVWATGTAPPSATAAVLVPHDSPIVRGQMGVGRRVMILGGVIITSGVVGGVIGYNVRDDDSPAS